MVLSEGKRKKLAFTSVYFTFFVDNLSWSIVFPIFAPLFLEPNNALLSPEMSMATRTTILGVFLMAFPLAQFFGAPIIGEYADRNGRKQALVITILFTLVGIVLSAWSIRENWLILLFISRVITGVFAGNLSICLAAIADLSGDEQTKVKHFGYVAVMAGLSFIIGAFLGGKFSDSSLNPIFSYSFPFWIAAFLTILNLLFIIFAFREPKELDKSVKFDFLEGIHNIQQALKTKGIRTIYLIYFLFLFAWNILFQFTPVLLVRDFHFTNSEIGDVAAFMGICWAIGSGYLSKVLLRKFSPLKVLEFCLLSFTVFVALIIVPKTVGTLLFLLGASVIIAGLAWPLSTSVISNMASGEIQGKVMGISQSMQSLAMAIAPLVGGLVGRFHFSLPFLVAAFSSLAAGLIYFKVK